MVVQSKPLDVRPINPSVLSNSFKKPKVPSSTHANSGRATLRWANIQEPEPGLIPSPPTKAPSQVSSSLAALDGTRSLQPKSPQQTVSPASQNRDAPCHQALSHAQGTMLVSASMATAGHQPAALHAHPVGSAPGGSDTGKNLPAVEEVRGWTAEQKDELRTALQQIPIRAGGDVDAAFWERMERVAMCVRGRSALECAHATRLLAAARAGHPEAYYASAYFQH